MKKNVPDVDVRTVKEKAARVAKNAKGASAAARDARQRSIRMDLSHLYLYFSAV